MMKRCKYGAHIFLWTERWSSGEIFLIRKAASLGLDVLEIAVGDDVEFDASLIKKVAGEEGVEIVLSPGGVWPMEADLSSHEASHRRKGLDWHCHWIDKAAESNATAYTGALYAHPGHIDKRRITEEDLQYAAEGLHQLAEYAARRQVKIVLEPMSHFRVSLINTPRQVMTLIEKISHFNVYVLLDTYHLVTEIRDYGEAVKIMSPRLWGIHACENDRGVPGGGIVPWGALFSALKECNFSGYFILETYNSSIRNGDFAFSRGMFHHVCPDGDEFAKKGISFIKEQLRIHGLPC